MPWKSESCTVHLPNTVDPRQNHFIGSFDPQASSRNARNRRRVRENVICDFATRDSVRYTRRFGDLLQTVQYYSPYQLRVRTRGRQRILLTKFGACQGKRPNDSILADEVRLRRYTCLGPQVPQGKRTDTPWSSLPSKYLR